jgi:hypothetical protein
MLLFGSYVCCQSLLVPPRVRTPNVLDYNVLD